MSDTSHVKLFSDMMINKCIFQTHSHHRIPFTPMDDMRDLICTLMEPRRFVGCKASRQALKKQHVTNYYLLSLSHGTAAQSDPVRKKLQCCVVKTLSQILQAALRQYARIFFIQI
jgi:hypothetical protein